jgi:germination protein M
MKPYPKLLALSAMALVVACGGGTPQGQPTSTATTTPSATPSTTPSTTPTPAATTVAAYFVRAEKMAAATRTATGQAVATAAVRALLTGPTAAELSGGLSTAVPAGTELRSLKIENGLAVVDLTGAFASGGGSLSMGERLAQLVTTVTQFPSASKVRLWLDGRPATTLGGEGLMVDRALGRADVEEYLPAILVDSPAAGARISSPVQVRGSADVFEAVFFVEITDWDGRVVATQRVMASSGTGTRGTFDVTIPYRTDRSGHGELIVFSHSPKDGARINVVETALVVAP